MGALKKVVKRGNSIMGRAPGLNRGMMGRVRNNLNDVPGMSFMKYAAPGAVADRPDAVPMPGEMGAQPAQQFMPQVREAPIMGSLPAVMPQFNQSGYGDGIGAPMGDDYDRVRMLRALMSIQGATGGGN